MKRWLLVAAALALGCSTDSETQVVQGTALDHGRALFSDPTASPSPVNTFSCATCHRADEPDDGRILPGAILAGAVDRPTFTRTTCFARSTTAAPSS
jgi:thiosulfate dehydrogenase